MKAIVQDHYGSEKALKLEDVDKPEVGDGRPGARPCGIHPCR